MPTDESYLAPLFNKDAPEAMGKSVETIATGLGHVEQAASSAGKSISTVMGAAHTEIKKVLDDLDQLKTATGAATGVKTGEYQPKHAAEPASMGQNVAGAIQGVATTLEHGLTNLANRFVSVITNIFGGSNAAGPTTAAGAILPGAEMGPVGTGAGTVPGAATSSNAGTTAVALGLYGLGQAISALPTAIGPGMQWLQQVQNLAALTGGGYGSNSLTTVAAMVNAAGGTGFNTGVLWGGNIPQLGQAEQTLTGIRGGMPNAGGASGAMFTGAMAQAGVAGLINQQGIAAGAGTEAWLATAAGRNFLFTIGLNPNDPKNQNLIGVAESIATRLNGGKFPNKTQLAAMMGPGQPLDNTLMYLLGNMGMSNPAGTMKQLENTLMSEAATETAAGQYLSLGSAQTAAQVKADEDILGLNKTQYAQQQAALQETAAAKLSRTVAVKGAIGVIAKQKKVGEAANSKLAQDLSGVAGVASELEGFIGGLPGPVKTIGEFLLTDLGAKYGAKAALAALSKLPGPLGRWATAKRVSGTKPTEEAKTVEEEPVEEAKPVGVEDAAAGDAGAVDAGVMADLMGPLALGLALVPYAQAAIKSGPFFGSPVGKLTPKATTAQLAEQVKKYLAFQAMPGGGEEQNIIMPAHGEIMALQQKGFSTNAIIQAFGAAGLSSQEIQLASGNQWSPKQIYTALHGSNDVVGSVHDKLSAKQAALVKSGTGTGSLGDGYYLQFTKGSIVIQYSGGGSATDAQKLAEEVIAELDKQLNDKNMVKK